jgi:uncharacterized protein YutE (UPF0331/DUF86 family)
MHPPAMLVAVVDAWSSLISRHGGRQARDPIQALEVLARSAEQGRIDGDSLELLRTLVRSGGRGSQAA